MSALSPIRAHGGQGATAGQIGRGPQVHAILRGTTRTIRVWNGVSGQREEFMVEEARALCAAGDAALTAADHRGGCARGFVSLWLAEGDERGRSLELPVGRAWLIAFLAAVRGALRTLDAATVMAACVDTDSDPGAWARHLRHTDVLRGAVPRG